MTGLVIGVGVHRYHPHIGGSELHARCIAEGLSARGQDVVVIAPRESTEPRMVNGVRVEPGHAAADGCDVVITYSVSPETVELARRLGRPSAGPRWLHHPCAVSGSESLELVRQCDAVIAMNPKDVALAGAVGRRDTGVVRVTPASHPSRIGRPANDSFRRRLGLEGDFIVWVGAWLRAKGPRHLSRRFAELRRRRPEAPLKLVMFGGYGEGMPGAEFPDAHPDIVRIDGNAVDVPDAISQSRFVAFNSPPHPVGFDANPLVLLEAMMNGKTFVAQAGTPMLTEISHLGMVVGNDDAWLRAATRLLDDERHRAWLERRCRDAYRTTYNLDNMLDGIERAIARTYTGISS